MKDKKNLLLLLPILVFVATYVAIYSFNNTSLAATDTQINEGASDGDTYVYKRESQNLQSHYIISNNNGWTSGLKRLFATKDNSSVITYCAEQGVDISSSAHTRYSINSNQLNVLDTDRKEKLNKMMKYAYPYITLGDLKTALQNEEFGMGSKYQTLDMANLTAQEAVTAVQASIWNIIENTTKYNYYTHYNNVEYFNSCFDYYTNKILTSEEEVWYQESECSSSGNFYKYIYAHSDAIVDGGKRINALIDWYISTLQDKISSNTETFKINGEPEFSNVTDSTYTVTVTFDTNMLSYNIVFKDDEGNDLSGIEGVDITHTGNTYVLENVPRNITTINVEVRSNTLTKNVFWYTGSGQDFIGVENSSKATVNLEIEYERQPGKVVLYKVTGSENGVQVIDGEAENQCGGTNQPACVSGAKFALYYKNKTKLKKSFTIKNGKFEINNLTAGTYYLKEIEPAKGYDFYEYGKGLVDNEGYIELTISEGNTKTVVINNEKTKICFKKVSDEEPDKILSGAEYEITDFEGNVLQKFTSDSTEGAKCYEGNFRAGSYLIRETKAPDGYSLDTRTFAFNVGRNVDNLDENYPKLTVVNNIITIVDKKGVVISKSDLTNGACVSGATLTIKDSTGKVRDSWVSTCKDKNGNGNDSHTTSVCVDGGSGSGSSSDNNCLGPGTYTLTEEIHPDGYATAETITFTIDEDGKITGNLDMKDAPITACFIKIDSAGKKLKGAKFELYKESDYESGNAKPFKSFTSTASDICFPYIPVGNYILKETKAPNGYEIKNEITKIEIKDTGDRQEFYIENEVIAPKTSMNYSKIIVIIASVIMVLGLGMVGYYGFKKHN